MLAASLLNQPEGAEKIKRLSYIKDHIKDVSRTIKSYRAKAKEINAAANELAKSNAKLKRELKRALS